MLKYSRMRISDHYRPFEKKTLIAVTNNEFARLLKAEGQEVEEIATIKTPDTAAPERVTAGNGRGGPDLDALKVHRLKELYSALTDKLRDLLDHDDYKEAIVCVPEVNKNIFTEYLPADLAKRLHEVVPKNLASMDIPHIVRILLEG